MKTTILIAVSFVLLTATCFGQDDTPSVSLGLKMASLDKLQSKLDKDALKELPPTQKTGMLVLELKEDSNYGKIGGQKFDVITKIGSENIKDTDAIKAWMKTVKPDTQYTVNILRKINNVWRPQTLKFKGDAIIVDTSGMVGDSISVKLLKKDFHAFDLMAGDKGDSINISLLLRNKLKKDIKAFSGTVKFADQFGDTIQSVKLKCEDWIPVDGTATWTGSVSYNQFMDADRKLRAAKAKDLKTTLVVHKVIYVDGSTEEISPE